MNKFIKIGIVVVGYVLAVACAVSYFFLFPYRPNDPSGMAAFGEFVLFLGIVGALALIPTALALYWLRPFKRFWFVLALLCLLFALTGPFITIASRALDTNGTLNSNPALVMVSFLGVLHMLGTPLLFIGFLIAAALAPSGRPRVLMLSSAGVELLFGLSAFAMLFLANRGL